MSDRTHDPELKSWVESANDPATDFPVQNLPYVTFVRAGARHRRPGAVIGDQVLDLSAAFRIDDLGAIMRMARLDRIELRRRISNFLTGHTPRAEAFLTPLASVS